MKKFKMAAALLLSLCIGFLVTACGSSRDAVADSSLRAPQSAEDSGDAQIPNPWVSEADQQAAEAQAGFSITLPQAVPEGYEGPSFQVIPGDILEADYEGSNGAELCIRKGAGTEDPSGDYNDYSGSWQVTVENTEVTMKGNDGAVSLAVWQADGAAYSIGIYDAPGITAEEMSKLIQEMMERTGE